MTRADFLIYGLKGLSLGELMASFLPQPLGGNVHKVLDLLGTGFRDDMKFTELCDILGLPPDPVPRLAPPGG